MTEFIDRTGTQSGTLINRQKLMAVQGFDNLHTVFNDDGSITQTNTQGDTLTITFNADGSITEVFNGNKEIAKTTTFNADGTISEVLE